MYQSGTESEYGIWKDSLVMYRTGFPFPLPPPKKELTLEQQITWDYKLNTDWESKDVAEINKKLVASLEKNGRGMAPDYKTANCTEFLTGFLSMHFNLRPSHKSQINVVIPNQSIDMILANLKAGKPQPEYGGVCHFVTANLKGVGLNYWEDLKPGDLVQWWWHSGRQGHCGIIKEVNMEQRWFAVYSSTPKQGFGVTRYPIDFDAHFFFARITQTDKQPN